MAYVQLPPDSIGKTISTVIVAGDHRQCFVLADPTTAANLASVTKLGSIYGLLVAPPQQWSVNHTPAAATQATITKAAGATGISHVCASISATFSTAGTAQATPLLLNLRDGATGAGTILWSKQVVLPVNGIWEVSISGLAIVGTTATAMTLEFSGAGAAASLECVSMTGYDVS